MRRLCAQCGEMFTPHRCGTEATQKYCSRTCRDIAATGTGRTREALCQQCGEKFKSRPQRLGMTKYCSSTCYGIASRKPETRSCKVCGEQFVTVPSRSKRTCSRECANAAKAAAKIGARNPHFKGAESVKLQEANWHGTKAVSCARCGVGNALHLHHVIYRQEVRRRGGWVFDPRDGLTLCVACHTSHHKNLRENTLPLVLLRDENYEFAAELMGPGAAYEYLRRRYGGEDERLEGLLVKFAELAA